MATGAKLNKKKPEIKFSYHNQNEQPKPKEICEGRFML